MVRESYGICAKFIIVFDGTLTELSEILFGYLKIPAFRIENLEDPPYTPIAYCDFFGLNIDLEPQEGNNFYLM